MIDKVCHLLDIDVCDIFYYIVLPEKWCLLLTEG